MTEGRREASSKKCVSVPGKSSEQERYSALERVWHLLGRLSVRLLARGFACLPGSYLADLIQKVVTRRANRLPADEALRFLFRLDAALYPIQGQKSVEYDGGIHTKHRHIRYHDFFVERVLAGERVLDIGCGIGALAYSLARKAEAHVVGIDVNPDNIAQARERYVHPNVQYVVGDALKDLPAEFFDLIILSNVLEHLPERPAFLRRVREITKASRFLIRVPLFEREWRVPLKKELNVEWRLDSTHEIEYTLESFAQEQAAAGLNIMHQEVRWGEIWAEAVPDGSQD
ncbi:MAG: class I SAM-dependent methyltransferase [Candidatus Thorarchaeota archaeon]|jgi:SAM-dependent methyltransferase